MSENLPLLAKPHEAEDDFNLTIIRAGESIAMGRKTRGYGKGRLVLPGGKTRYYIGESGVAVIPFRDEAAREANEETGLDLTGARLVQKGILHIADEDDTRMVRLYETRLPSVTAVRSTELADIGWYGVDALPYADMPVDYSLWLPHILGGYAVTAFLENDLQRLVDARIFRQKLSPLGRVEQVDVKHD